MGGYTLTLPVKWIRENHLENVNEVEVTETNEGLLLTGKQLIKEKRIAIDVSSFDERMILNILNQLYRTGYDYVDITYKDEKAYHQIQSIVRDVLLGFEIVHKKDNICAIQNIAEPEEQKFDIILRRIFLQIKELSLTVFSSFEKNIFLLPEILETKIQIDKLTNYARRTIIHAKISGQRNVLLYSVVSQLSLIAHSYYYLSAYFFGKKKKIDAKKLDFLVFVNDLYNSFYESFYTKDLLALNKIGESKNDFFEKTEKILEKSTGVDAVFLSYLRELVRLIQMCIPSTLGAII